MLVLHSASMCLEVKAAMSVRERKEGSKSSLKGNKEIKEPANIRSIVSLAAVSAKSQRGSIEIVGSCLEGDIRNSFIDKKDFSTSIRRSLGWTICSPTS